jgi:hypothetical protein
LLFKIETLVCNALLTRWINLKAIGPFRQVGGAKSAQSVRRDVERLRPGPELEIAVYDGISVLIQQCAHHRIYRFRLTRSGSERVFDEKREKENEE